MKKQIKIDRRNSIYDTVFWAVISLATCGAGFISWLVIETLLHVIGAGA